MYSVLLSECDCGMKLVCNRLRALIKENSKVVVIAWTFPMELNYEKFEKDFLNKQRREKYINSLIMLGINQKNIKFLNCYDTNNFQNFKKYIDESDVMVLTGGNPEMLYSKVVQDTEILYNIKHYKGIVIGFSAGAELQLKRYFITAKNNYYKYFAFYDGFGILDDPFYFDVHSINNNSYLNKLKRIANDTKKNVYAIFNDGGLIYNRSNGKIEIYGNVKIFKPTK